MLAGFTQGQQSFKNACNLLITDVYWLLMCRLQAQQISLAWIEEHY